MKKFLLISVLAVAASSCAVKDNSLPVPNPDGNNFFYSSTLSGLTTTSNSIVLEGLSLDVTGAEITRYGICCAIGRLPYITDYVAEFITGEMHSGPLVIDGLAPSTTYTCRAFFVTSDGAAYYSDPVEVTTTPVLSLALDGFPTSNTKDGGYVNAVVTSGSLAACKDKGFCYGASETPTVNDNKVSVAGSSDTMTAYISMSPGQIYYYRAFAILQDGTVVYSDTSAYIQTYAVTEHYYASSVMYGSFYSNGETYPYQVSLDTYYSYYSVSDLTDIGFKEADSSWHYNSISEGLHSDSRTWFFMIYRTSLTYQAYAVLKSGKKIWGEEKTASFSL